MVGETFRKFNDISKEDGNKVADAFSGAVVQTMNGIADSFGLQYGEITGQFGAQLIRSAKNGFQVKIGDTHFYGYPDDPNNPDRVRGNDPETGAVIWTGQSQRFGSVVAAGSGHHLGSPRHALDHFGDHPIMFIVGQRGRLAGGPSRDDALGTGRNLKFQLLPQPRVVHFAVGKWRNDGNR